MEFRLSAARADLVPREEIRDVRDLLAPDRDRGDKAQCAMHQVGAIAAASAADTVSHIAA